MIGKRGEGIGHQFKSQFVTNMYEACLDDGRVVIVNKPGIVSRLFGRRDELVVGNKSYDLTQLEEEFVNIARRV